MVDPSGSSSQLMFSMTPDDLLPGLHGDGTGALGDLGGGGLRAW